MFDALNNMFQKETKYYTSGIYSKSKSFFVFWPTGRSFTLIHLLIKLNKENEHVFNYKYKKLKGILGNIPFKKL